MSILAEPRRKQKISIDPQNLTWKNDDQKLSKKLMEKMGWNEGDGLGVNRQGNSEAVKLKPNRSGKGLGADKLTDYDSTWLTHHDDFADLLEALNKNKEKEADQNEEERAEAAEKVSIELRSKQVRRRIHYQKFTRAKDTSNYNDEHKKGILGLGRTKNDKKEETAEKKEESDESSQDNGDRKEGNNTVSTLSVGDYFAAKMAALKAKKEATTTEKEIKTEIKEEIDSETEEEKAKKKAEKKERKRLRREQREKEAIEQTEVEVKLEVKEEPLEEIEDEQERKRLKKEKKRLKRLHEQEQEKESADAECDYEAPCKKRKIQD